MPDAVRALAIDHVLHPTDFSPASEARAFRIPVHIEMIDVFVAPGQRALDGVPCPLALLAAIRSLLWSHAQLQAEVLALRHQLLETGVEPSRRF